MLVVRQFYGHLLVTACVLGIISGHGRLVRPVGRATMWRQGYDTPHDYNDHQLYCGGRGHQWNVNNGKCGVCGDPYDKPQPRDHEAGGKYGKGIVVERYIQGQVIKVKIEVTANHGGNFEFRICDTNNPKVIATEECLNRNLLATKSGETKIKVMPGRDFNIELLLSPYLTCSHCVFQWKWEAAQNPGNQQEHFVNCADVAISPRVNPPTPYITPTPQPFIPPTQKPYVPQTQQPYIPPYYPQPQKPYIPQPPKPYIPQTIKPYIQQPLPPYLPPKPQTSKPLPFNPNFPFPYPFFTQRPASVKPTTSSSVTPIPPLSILRPKCPAACMFYCTLIPKLCPDVCKTCNMKSWLY